MSAEQSEQEVQLIIQSIENEIQESLAQLPWPWRKLVAPFVKRNLKVLRQKVRIPRIALYGRSGAGKSSIVNALLGRQVAPVGVDRPTTMKPESYSYSREGWSLYFVDTRGVGDDFTTEAVDAALQYVVREKVDIVLFVIPVTERGWVTQDIDFLSRLRSEYKRHYDKDIPVILVFNKIDMVSPTSEWSPPYRLSLEETLPSPSSLTAHNSKEINIRKAIRARLDEYKTLTTTYVPISAAWNEFEDRRYNIDELALKVYETIPDEARPAFAGATALLSVKKAISRSMIWTSALIAASTSFVPLPGVDAMALVAIQAAMIGVIVKISATRDERQSGQLALKFIKNIGGYGAGATLSVLANQIAKFIPGAGTPVTASSAAAVGAITVAMGEAAIRHFIEGAPMEETRLFYREERKRMQEWFKEALMNNNPQQVVSKIKQLELYASPTLRSADGATPLAEPWRRKSRGEFAGNGAG